MKKHIKEIFEKPKEEWTEDERAEVDKSIKEFSDEIQEVCEKYGYAYEAVLQHSPKGILPTLQIVKFSRKEE